MFKNLLLNGIKLICVRAVKVVINKMLCDRWNEKEICMLEEKEVDG